MTGNPGRGAEGDDRRHRRARRRLEGRRLVRPQRAARRVRGDAGPRGRDRARARLVPQPGGALALGLTRPFVWPRDRPPVADSCARAVLHGVHRRCRGGAVGPVGGAHDPARARPRGGGRGLPALVGRAARRRRHAHRPARRRPARRRDRAAWPAGGRRGRAAPRRRRPRSGTTRRSRSAKSSATSPRSGTSGGSRRGRGGLRPQRPAQPGVPGGGRRAGAERRDPGDRLHARRAARGRRGSCSRGRSGRRRSSTTATSWR